MPHRLHKLSNSMRRLYCHTLPARPKGPPSPQARNTPTTGRALFFPMCALLLLTSLLTNQLQEKAPQNWQQHPGMLCSRLQTQSVLMRRACNKHEYTNRCWPWGVHTGAHQTATALFALWSFQTARARAKPQQPHTNNTATNSRKVHGRVTHTRSGLVLAHCSTFHTNIHTDQVTQNTSG